jgi:hypothetical protein
MTDLEALKQVARFTHDEHGQPVVQIPLAAWTEFMAETGAEPPQHERIKALLKEWEEHPDDTPAEWWDEFEEFLKQNRVNFPERDLDFGE